MSVKPKTDRTSVEDDTDEGHDDMYTRTPFGTNPHPPKFPPWTGDFEGESLIVSRINLDINCEQKTVIPIYLKLRSETCFHVYIFVGCVGDWKTKNRDEVKRREV